MWADKRNKKVMSAAEANGGVSEERQVLPLQDGVQDRDQDEAYQFESQATAE